VTSTPHRPEAGPADDFTATDELVRRRRVRPIASVEDLAAADDPFESDEEYEEFLADSYASRRAELALALSVSTRTCLRATLPTPRTVSAVISGLREPHPRRALRVHPC
jgi:hypothetical protein